MREMGRGVAAFTQSDICNRHYHHDGMSKKLQPTELQNPGIVITLVLYILSFWLNSVCGRLERLLVCGPDFNFQGHQLIN